MLKLNWTGTFYYVDKGRSVVGAILKGVGQWHFVKDSTFCISPEEQDWVDNELARLNGGQIE